LRNSARYGAPFNPSSLPGKKAKRFMPRIFTSESVPFRSRL